MKLIDDIRVARSPYQANNIQVTLLFSNDDTILKISIIKQELN